MEEKSNASEDQNINGGAGDGGWQKVKSRKKERNQNVNAIRSYSTEILNKNVTSNHDVVTPVSYTGSIDGVEVEPPTGTEKKKQKGAKKQPTVTPAQAATKIDAADLSAFLAEVTASYATKEDIQLMTFADYFGKAFSAVSAAQFPWLELFRDSTLDKIVDVPLCHISEALYKISADWIDTHSHEGLKSFVIWSLNTILSNTSIQKSLSSGTTKNGAQNTSSSKSQVSMFLVISIVLKRRPEVLISLLPLLSDDSKYHGQDKLLVISWMIAQAAKGDITVGLYVWARHMLPLLEGKSGSNPKTRDFILQVVERILSVPNARKILSKGATRNGERMIPPFALEPLLRVTFPAPSARVKATERFEEIYPTLIYVVLYGSPRGKEMQQLSQQIQPLLLKVAGEEIRDLSQEAAKIFIWCLIQTPDCYKNWGKMYMSNLKASVVILGRLKQRWKFLSPKLSDLSNLRNTLKVLREKNKKAMGEGVDAASLALIKEADMYCLALLKCIFRGRYWWVMIVSFCFIWMALGVGVYYFWLRVTY